MIRFEVRTEYSNKWCPVTEAGEDFIDRQNGLRNALIELSELRFDVTIRISARNGKAYNEYRAVNV